MLMFTPIRMRAHVNYHFWIEHGEFCCFHSATEDRPPASRLGFNVFAWGQLSKLTVGSVIIIVA